MTIRKSSSSHKERRPSIEALRALATLAETGNISETARRLGVSQPVISKKLQVFKDEGVCGAILLRSGSSTELTEAAQSILPAIEELVGRYDRIMRFLHGEEVGPRVLRIGAGSFSAEHYLPKVIASLREELDDCQIETQVCRGRERILGTARGVFDLSIVTHDRSQIRQTLRDDRLDENVLSIESLGRHAMCVLARRDSHAGRQLAELDEEQIVPVSRLAEWELVGPDRQSGLRRQLEQRLRGKALYFAVEGGGWTAAKQFALQNLGVAIVPRATITSTDQSKLISRRLASEFDVTDFLLYRNDDNNNLVTQASKAFTSALTTKS